MRKYSKKRQQQESNLRGIERKLKMDPANDRCFFFRMEPRSSFDHIIPKAHNQELIDCAENLVPISTRAHNIITFGTADQIRQLPRFDEYLERMKLLDEGYYRRFIMKFEDTITYHDLKQIDHAKGR